MISDLVSRITPSPTVGLVGKVAELKQAGVDVIGYHLGEPDFKTPQHICEAAKRAIDEGRTQYTATPGILPLRKAISKKLEEQNGALYAPSQICCSTGAKQALVNVFMSLCNAGDEIIIPTPCWVSYVEMVKIAQGTAVLVPCSEESGFQPDLAAIEAAITDKTRAILLTSPNNPTGAVYPKAVLEAVLALAEKHDFYIISDEIYEALIFGDAEFHSVASLSPTAKDRTILINGFSKSHAMTGWRSGYSAAPPDIARAIADLQGHMSSNCCSIAQYAALAALEGPQDSVEAMRLEYDKRRKALLTALRAIPGVTCADVQGAFYLFPNVSAYYGKEGPSGRIENGLDLCNYLLDEAAISIVPGSAFEAPEYLRLSYALSMEQMLEGVRRMRDALEKLR